MINIKLSKQESIIDMEKIVIEGNKISELKLNTDIEVYAKMFNEWRECAIKSLKSIFKQEDLALRFEAETIYLENSFSKISTKSEINNDIPKEIAMIIIRRIMKNFYKHIKVMYQDEVHGRANILKSDLDKIKIGNEYDVQRILYSIIKPIFPLARLEVSNDIGYNSVRYDIYIDEYDVVIELKCTRSSMSERNITEELGSDIFHYKSNNLFFFIYDKEKIIKNVDAFTKVYTKRDDNFNKNIETIVIQPIVL